ncbi:MAG TPA: substrate-binding domain-containing protein [Epulopiscium sp.]|nr:substrate-binding domain-containing protein [Candidatus Epulonipiscium sp.]
MAKVAKYIKIMDWIMEQIAVGAVQPGEKLDSENILSETFKVSRQTVRRALEELEKADYITRVKGSGTYVSENQSLIIPTTIDDSKLFKTVGIITTYLDAYIFPSIIQGIETELTKKGFILQVMSTKNIVENELRALQMMSESNLDGLIIWPSKSSLPCINLNLYKSLSSKGLPMVFVDSYYPAFPATCVCIDDVAIGMTATNHLISMGHTNITGIFPHEDIQGHLRYQGYAKALVAAGLPLSDEHIHWYSKENVEEDLTKASLWKSLKECSAAFCFNDSLALMLIDQLHHKEIFVPEDFSVVGVDNIFMAKRAELTSIIHPGEKLGTAVAELLISMINGKRSENIFFQPQLISRNSVKNLNSSL